MQEWASSAHVPTLCPIPCLHPWHCSPGKEEAAGGISTRLPTPCRPCLVSRQREADGTLEVEKSGQAPNVRQNEEQALTHCTPAEGLGSCMYKCVHTHRDTHAHSHSHRIKHVHIHTLKTHSEKTCTHIETHTHAHLYSETHITHTHTQKHTHIYSPTHPKPPSTHNLGTSVCSLLVTQRSCGTEAPDG